MQYVPPDGSFHVDILALFDFDGLDLDVSVVTPGMLHRMKKGAVRPRAGADRLRQRFGFEGE